MLDLTNSILKKFHLYITSTLFGLLFLISHPYSGQNCSGLNVVGSFFDLSSNPAPNYATALSNGECYTFSPPYPSQVCFEYMVPFSDTVRATFHMAACGSLSSIGNGTYSAGCSGTASTNATFTGQSTYDANCNLIGNYIAAGYCSGAVSGDILTVCFDLNTSSICDPITICPLLFCNTSICSTALPIELLNFDAICTENKTILNWTTSSEINNSYFSIERSSDGYNFNEIATINGAGNSNIIIHYSFTDDNNTSSIFYYRLKQTDFDGNFSFSKIISINCFTDNFNIYPNPTNNVLNIDFLNSSSIDKIIIFNAIGQIIGIFQINSSTKQIDISKYANGFYQIHFFSENQSIISKKIIKK